MNNSATSFISSLADRYLQMKMFQMQQRREERYDKQLAANQRLAQRRLDISERSSQALSDYRTQSLDLQRQGMAETQRYHSGMMGIQQAREKRLGEDPQREIDKMQLEWMKNADPQQLGQIFSR